MGGRKQQRVRSSGKIEKRIADLRVMLLPGIQFGLDQGGVLGE